eukprot:6455503-Amphidinium_carterae.1
MKDGIPAETESGNGTEHSETVEEVAENNATGDANETEEVEGSPPVMICKLSSCSQMVLHATIETITGHRQQHSQTANFQDHCIRCLGKLLETYQLHDISSVL